MRDTRDIAMDTIVTLYENFNTTNQTSPHYEYHQDFIEAIREADCSLVLGLHANQRCFFVETQKKCEHIYFIHYYKILYCHIGSDFRWRTILFSIAICCFMFYIFVMMGTLSSKFFCPSISVFAHMLGLSENVAGVTLLAFGNGLNDLITSIAGSDRVSRIYLTDTYGTNLYVVNFVTGILILIQPFEIPTYSFLRDVGFLLLDVLMAELFFNSDDKVTLIECLLMIFLYVVYMSVVIFEHFLIKHIEKKAVSNPLKGSISRTFYLGRYKHNAPMEIISRRTRKKMDVTLSNFVIDFKNTRNQDLWEQLFEDLNPWDYKNWRKFDKGCFMRSYILLRTPYMLMLNLFIPVVDYNEPRSGWSKMLNCIQIVILPFTLAWLLLGYSHWRICLVTLFITLPLSIYIFHTTRTDVPPSHHTYMSILTLCGASILVYACAEEVLCIVDVLGVITSRSNTFLGATLFAWGKSFNDFLSNIILFRQGYLLMGFAGCFGTPLYNAMVSLGLFTLYKILQEPNLEYAFGEGTFGEQCSIFLVISLIGILVFGTFCNFYLRRGLGIFLLIMYLAFFISSVLVEMELVHAYGTDHRLDIKIRYDRIETDLGLMMDLSSAQVQN